MNNIFEIYIKNVNFLKKSKVIFLMIKDNYLDINKIVKDKKIFRLFRAVENHGGVLRFVGGAVRNALKGIEGADLDLATDLSPDELVEACVEHGIKTVPIGIKFGTVGVVINGKILEVTSLRKDIKSDGRHSEVVFTTDWEIDASRRDLTINAVYADEKGNVFDYYNGISDLENGIVRFIGNPSIRINEDYLRILRFFRFYADFGNNEIDIKSLKACKDNSKGLKQLSGERIRDELSKILLSSRAPKVVKIMADNGILDNILPEMKHFENLDFIIKLCDKHKLKPNWLRRLFICFNPDKILAESLANRLKLSKKDRLLFVSLAENDIDLSQLTNKKLLSVWIYRLGKDFCTNKLILQLAQQNQDIENLSELLDYIDNKEIPEFPVRGRDLIALGLKENIQIGSILKILEKKWIESDFSLSKDELLKEKL